MSIPSAVPTSAPKARPRSTPKAVLTTTHPDKQKKVRKDGRVASTILLSPQVDEWLSYMALVRQRDRSDLACDFIMQGLARNTGLVSELMQAAERFKKFAPAKPDASDVDRESASLGADVKSEATAEAA
jgi:hypothetical protein